jgi:hypothetical protein
MIPFDGSLPTGWVAISLMNARYPRGDNETTTTGGFNTHTHTATGTTGSAVGGTLDGRNGGTSVSASSNTHTHTISTSTPPLSHEPPYVEVVFASTTSATTTPVGALTMWTDTPPAQWLHSSEDSTGTFFGKFMKGGTVYGATGGAVSHTHADMNGFTSSGATPAQTARTGGTGANITHTHAVDVVSFSTDGNLPPYATAIIARKYGAVPIYTQTGYRWFVNADLSTSSDPWPQSSDDLLENERISATSTPLRLGDVIRLRLGIGVLNSTSTAEQFKLQFASSTDSGLCSALTNWSDVGSATSSSVWRGYDNASVSDGTTLTSSTLSRTDVFETYEESNPTAVTPNQIGLAQDGEWDFVLEQNGAEASRDYCFRMTKLDGSPLFAYTYYPRLRTNESPHEYHLDMPFDNEKVSSTTPIFEFIGTDDEGDSHTYEIIIDDTYAFTSPVINVNSETNFTLFSNVTTPADKDPFTNGETIRFKSNTALANGTTYYWRIRSRDTGSGQYGSWSSVQSFTVDTSLSVSAWFQTSNEQFTSNTLTGVTASAGSAQLIVGSTTGTLVTNPITFADGTKGNAWGSLVFNDTEVTGDITYQLEYEVSTGAWALIPDTALTGNSAGFDTSPVSLLGLDTQQYPTIRVRAVFTNVGGSPSLQDMTVLWGYKIDTPTITKLFPSEKTSTTTPLFEFKTTDPQNDDLVYEVQWSTSNAFTSSTTRTSDISLGYSNITTPADTSPFISGNTIQYKVQNVDAFTNGQTYWWRVRARDPSGSNTFSNYTEARSLTVDTSVTVSTWFQTTGEQFGSNAVAGATTNVGAVTVATTAVESLVAYAEGNIQTPRYRTWNGSVWSEEQSALSVGAAINWVVTRAAPTREEYVMATIGTDQDANIQVYSNGAWGSLQEVTQAISDAGMRGIDIAYESSSGDALAVSCDGDADPAYWIWNGTTWTNGGTVNLVAANSCGFVRLFADPLSDEIVLVTRDVLGARYELMVWNGSSWGNGTTAGRMQNTQLAHEGIAGGYEESSNQAVFAVSNDTASSFVSLVWNGSTWSTSTVAIGDDFEFGSIASDVGSDNMALCYIDADSDVGFIRWNGTAWVTPATELTVIGNSLDGRTIDCAYRVGGAFDGHLMMTYSDTANVRYRYWDGTALQPGVEGTVSTLQDAWTVQLGRIGNGDLQLLAYDDVNDRYDFSLLPATSTTWGTFSTLETNGSVGAAPFKEPFMVAPRKPGVSATVAVDPLIDWNDGSGPYFQSLSWNDTKPGSSNIKYHVEYYDGDSWERVPDSLIPGNSGGTSTSPLSLTATLPVATTYNLIRPVATLTCALGVCPSINDWTLTWSAGITVSGTAQQYNQSTNLTSGTVAVALNGVLQVGKTGTISGGAWSIANVNAAPGDVITVFIDGATDTSEAVAVTVYDGVGDVSGMNLMERHLSVGSDDRAIVTNAHIGLYDRTNDEDLFFDVVSGALTCASGEGACTDAELIVKAQNTYQPNTDSTIHDLENNGTLALGGTTLRLSGSWDNNATTTAATSTVIVTATSTTETIDSTGAIVSSFNNLTLGEAVGSPTLSLLTPLDIDGALTVSRGTLSRGTQSITVAGNVQTGVNGVWSGIGTTTFDGANAATWSDQNTTKQNIGHVVIDGATKSVTLTGDVAAQNVLIGANDTLDANTPTSYDITVFGNWNNTNVWNPRQGEARFAATSTGRTITMGGANFYDLSFQGSGGAWGFASTTLTVSNDITIATGTVTFPTGTTTVGGSFSNTGGTFAHNNGTLLFTATTPKTITFGGTAFTNTTYNLVFSGSAGTWNITDQYATTSNDVRVTAGTPTLPNSLHAIGGSLVVSGGSLVAGTGTVQFFGATPKNVTLGGASLHNVTFNSSALSTFTDTNATLAGTLRINTGTTQLPTGTLTLGGSFINQNIFSHSSGTVLMNSNDAGEVVSPGSSSFHALQFNHASGGWTITQHATTTASTTLTLGNVTLASGARLSVGGGFVNTIGGTSTTWTGSTLALVGNSTFTVNSTSTPGDVYETVAIPNSAAVRMWNSSVNTVTVSTNGYLYSQDHAGIDGDLNIYGAYTRTGGSEYWSATNDFDGAVLSTPRQARVRFATGSSARFTSSLLSIVGTSTASTSVSSLSGSTYSIDTSFGTSTLQYFTMTDLGLSGLTLGTSSIILTLSDGSVTPGVAGASALRIASSTINAAPAAQPLRMRFSTSTAIAATNVTQYGGTPTSYWWFAGATGNLSGESYDNDTGNPGSIRWDDSLYSVTISGTVYSDAGTTPLGAPTCDGVTQNVRMVINSGSSTYSGACSAVTGAYSISGVSFVGDPVLTAYLNTNGGARGSVITKTISGDTSGVHIYQNRVITRHHGATPLSIVDMALYDEDNDSDLRFNATTSPSASLTVRGETELLVFASTTFTPGGSVTLQSGGSGASYDGTFHIDNNATATSITNEQWSVGGRFQVDSNGVFTPASSTVVMTATTTGRTISSPQTISLNALTFTGTGSYDLVANLSVANGISLQNGTLQGTGNITLTGGAFSGNGTLALTGGTTTLERSSTYGGTTPWQFYSLALGNGSIVGTTTPQSSATTTVLNSLQVRAAHTLLLQSGTLDLRGTTTPLSVLGSFDEGTSRVRFSGASSLTIPSDTYYHLDLNAVSGSPTYTTTNTGIYVRGDLTLGGAVPTTLNLNANDPVVQVDGTTYIRPNGAFGASDSSLLTFRGNYDNDGVFVGNGGTTTFNALTPQTVAAGTSSFSKVTLQGSSTIAFTEAATSTGAFFMLNTSGFTMATGTRLAVGGTFRNEVSGALTTWNNAPLYLFSGTTFEMNPKTTSDTYAALIVASSTQVRAWNSTFSSTTLDTTSSLYSQDHTGIDGLLSIFGTYQKTQGTDFWSSAYDFDSADISGTPRKVDVRFGSGSRAYYTGGGLFVMGTGAASTTITNQGSGTYDLMIGGTASTTMRYYEIRKTSTSGVVFTGTPTVVSLSNGDYLVEASGTALTVGGSVINQNPAKTFTNNTFASSTGIFATNVVATGTSVSSWRFTNESGLLSGELFDNDPGGDPGYIVWTTSAANISITGRVYSDEGVTVSSVCDGSTARIRLVVAGVTTYDTPCASGTGLYTFTNVSFSPADSLTLFINGVSQKGAAVSVDPITSISDMDIYENRVIVRHENTDPITIADMSLYDSSNDGDIPFTAVNAGTDTLTLPSDRKLIVWNSKEFTPQGNVTVTGNGGGAAYDGTLELYANARFTATGNESHTIGGSIISQSGALLNAASSTITLTTSASSRTLDVNTSAFHNLTFTGTGSMSVTDTTLLVLGSYSQSSGTITLPTATTTVRASFTNTGGTLLQPTSGTLYLNSGTAGNTVRFGGASIARLVVEGTGGTWAFTDTNATTTQSVTVRSGSLTLPSGTFAVGSDFVVQGSVLHNNGTVRLTGTTTGNLLSLKGSDLYSLTIAGTGGYTMTDGSVALLDSLSLQSGTIAFATNTLSIAGSLTTSGGTFTHASGTVLMNSADTGETVTPGTSPFYNLVFSNALGGWTVNANATTTNHFSLLGAANFTLSSGAVLSVGGVFTNTVGGTATTWTGSSIVLATTSRYSINLKTSPGDQYETLSIQSSAQVSMWNSSAQTVLTASNASLYSQDHAGVDGTLNIYGSYNRTSGFDYWSYATDFDGSVLIGAQRRAVTVRHGTNATSTFSGSATLSIVGDPLASTSITSVASSTYSLRLLGGILNAQYYAVRNTAGAGMELLGTTTITSLSSGDFELSQQGGALITVADSVVSANASAVHAAMKFATTTGVSGTNVVLIGSTSASWSFTQHTGNLSGESYDSDGGSSCGALRWQDSSCLLLEQKNYRWRNDDGGEGAPNGEWYNVSWSKRKRVSLTNNDGVAYTNAVVKVPVVYDSDMQTNFADLRFTASDGVTAIPYWRETFTTSANATVWVNVPTLSGTDQTTVFMYYGNSLATDASSGTTTWNSFDDFEDASISEYSGDTTLFNPGTGFAYERSRGLDTVGDENAQTTDGIYRTDLSVAQGQTIRYFQYINTTTGSSDEACTLFAVQSPGSNNNNYAVCLALFGVDRMTIAKNVSSNESSGTILASTTATFATGWHEVEVDWRTNNSLTATLYRNGTFIASTSVTDSTYTSGGIGFSYWFQHGGWDAISSRLYTATDPVVKTGVEQVSGGASWLSALNTYTSTASIGSTTRIRFGIENTGLAVTNKQFRLEYVAKGLAPSCESVGSGSYVPVPALASCGSSPLCMASSPHITSLASTTDQLGGRGTFTFGNTVEETQNTTASLNLASDTYTELEYAITTTVNATDGAYCVRTTDNGTPLDSYARVAEMRLRFVPTVTNVTLNSGNDIILTPGTTTLVSVTASTTDQNGFADITLATSTIFRTSQGLECVNNTNSCYQIASSSCAFYNCSGFSCSLQCSADVYYHADPTDVGAYSTDSWSGQITIKDSSNQYDRATSSARELLTLRALQVTQSINYGSVDVSSDTGSYNATTTIDNLGNDAIDISVAGTNLVNGASQIPVVNQKYATSTFTYTTCTTCAILASTTAPFEVDLNKPTTTSPTSDVIYWGISIPFGTAALPHQGQNTFYAIGD